VAGASLRRGERVVPEPVRQMRAEEAARDLEKSLAEGGTSSSSSRLDFTIADAAARSGLPLRDVESGLHALLATYRGHLRVTSEGELLFRFPNGFTRPWIVRSTAEAVLARAGRALAGVGRFIVRAWIAIVLVGYALIFLALVIGFALARSSGGSSSRDDRGVGLDLIAVLFRVVFDALFWTFHPFSPFAVSYGEPIFTDPRAYRPYAAPPEKKEPFYEKVNRFFFGPDQPPRDPKAEERAILAEIRAQKGRIGVGDVMRLTGLPRDQADPLMSRLMLDYDGTVEVSEEGGIFYRFESLRKTVEAPGGAVRRGQTTRAAPVWERPEKLPPLTGNSAEANLLIFALNGFNLVGSLYALGAGLTFEKIAMLMSRVPVHKIPDTGTAVALGVVPLVFSIALFALPALRALYRPWKAQRVARENGRRALLREVLTEVESGHNEVTDAALEDAWRAAAGAAPDEKAITREVVALGGDVEVRDDGKVRYRFPDLKAEALALKAEREAASEEEARVGKVIFSSEN
jgi:hypothetical protein